MDELRLDSYMRSIWSALSRARIPITTVALAYCMAVGSGIFMVQSGNQFALSYRDNLVSEAQTGVVLGQKNPLMQGLTDFGGNTLGAAVDTVLGFGVVLPYPMIVYRGWVGGIVSVDNDHISRLADIKGSAYYLSVVFLQLLGYSLAAGVGVHAGLSVFRARPENAGFTWFRVPKQALFDVLWIYALVVPIFLVASLWEFLSPWN